MSSKILILDDDEGIREVLTLLLTDSGYETDALAGGEHIQEEIKTFQPDLVVMDVMLGAMDGREICRDLKSADATHDLPVILISGTHRPGNVGQADGPNDFLAKPFDIHVLLDRIEVQLAA
jgi:DNA-binding response OmpR family regulator